MNCKGSHSSLNRGCPLYVKMKKANDEKAKRQQPKKVGFSNLFSHEAFPPLGTRKTATKKKQVPSNDGPSSIGDPPPQKRAFDSQTSFDSSDSSSNFLESASYNNFSSSSQLEPSKTTQVLNTENANVQLQPNPKIQFSTSSDQSQEEIMSPSPLVGNKVGPNLDQLPPSNTDLGYNKIFTQSQDNEQFPLGQKKTPLNTNYGS